MSVDASTFTATGQPDRIRSSAAMWASFANICAASSDEIGRVDLSEFRGDEADLHRVTMTGRLQLMLGATAEAWSVVAGALTSYAAELDSIQLRLSQMGAAAQEQSSASTALDDAGSRLTQTVAQAKAVQDEHRDALARCVGLIRQATQGRPVDPPAAGSVRGRVPWTPTPA